MEEIKNCPICENENKSVFLTCTDHFLTQEKFTIVECNECGFTFNNPRPSREQLAGYYNSKEYISHSGTEKGIVNTVYKKVRKFTHKRKLKLISQYSIGNKILDIGCGSGELLRLFKENNWETLGVEPNQTAREYAIRKNGIDVLEESRISEIQDGSFDVISMWHVLEHVTFLNERLQEIKRILKNDGVIFIAVPNRISFDAKYYDKYWAAYDVPRHLYHFTPTTIERLMKKHDFSIIAYKPMKFDSYYVSILSEKYKTGKSNLFKAIFIGLKSNIKASNKKHDYSSMVYILRKA